MARNPRKKFLDVLQQCSLDAPEDIQPRGLFDHFRRIAPPTWPRAFHYEILDYGGKIGIEIHLESESVLPLQPYVKAMEARLSQTFSQQEVEWDSKWYQGFGRLRVIFNEDVKTEEISGGLKKLIQTTKATFDKVASEIEVTPLSKGRIRGA